jgi:membrane protease YdiL (CAAX protease family)
MTASLLTKSALMGAFLFLGALSVYEGAVPDLSWWLEAPLLGLTLVVIAPVLEEWTFRGWLFDTLRAHFDGHDWSSMTQFSVISLHNLTTSALFVGLHIVMRDVQTGLLVLLPSLVLGLLRDRGVSLVSLMGIHGLWNFGWFAIYSPG